MTDIQIIGLTINYHTKQTPKGHCILAYFDAKVGPFILKGCALVRTAKEGLATWMPRLDDARSHVQRSVILVDESTRHQLLTAAREMYLRMGGQGAEWRSRDETLHPHRGCDEAGYPTHPLHPNYEAPAEQEARKFLTALSGELKGGEQEELGVDRQHNRPPAIDLPHELPPAIVRTLGTRLER